MQPRAFAPQTRKCGVEHRRRRARFAAPPKTAHANLITLCRSSSSVVPRREQSEGRKEGGRSGFALAKKTNKLFSLASLSSLLSPSLPSKCSYAPEKRNVPDPNFGLMKSKVRDKWRQPLTNSGAQITFIRLKFPFHLRSLPSFSFDALSLSLSLFLPSIVLQHADMKLVSYLSVHLFPSSSSLCPI